MASLEDVALKFNAKKYGDSYQARCPAHDDKRASLSISSGKDGKIILFCHASCSTENILAASGLTWDSLFSPKQEKPIPNIVRTYDYVDEHGKLVCQTVRFEPKDFRQRRPDGIGGWIWNLKDITTVLYQLPKVVKSDHVFIVEGEKDADNLAAIGIVATTSPMGAGKWKSHYDEYLRNKTIVIIPDNDDPGRKHARRIASSIQGKASSVKIIELPGLSVKEDVSDWIRKGGTKAELLSIAEQTEPDKPDKPDKPDSIDRTRQQPDSNPTFCSSNPTEPDNANLWGLIRKWVEESPGIFNTSEVDRELGLSCRKAKQNRSECLSRLVSEGIIERDFNRRGVFRKKDTYLQEMDILGAKSEELPIQLPFLLNNYIEINPKEIILVMGESNSGKTTVLFNMIWSNLKTLKGEGVLRRKTEPCFNGNFGIRYFSSEMGPTGVRKKLLAFGENEYPISEWVKYVSSVERNRDFQDVVDPCGLNFIDYLEVFDGEYFKLSSAITSIHAALKTGIAVIALQKKRGTDIGRGGEATLEKPRLAIALSENKDKGFSTAKIVKAKHYRERNPTGLELDFVIRNRGTKIIPVSDWKYAQEHQHRRASVNYHKLYYDE